MVNIKKEKILKEKESQGVDHITLYPRDEEYELRKKKSRELADKLREKNHNREAVIETSDGQIKYASQLTLMERELEKIKCTASPIYFIETYITIFDQTNKSQGEDGSIVPFRLFDFQKDLIRDYQNYRLNIANKYRQAGISTATSAYIAWYMSFTTIKRVVAIVADKQDTAVNEMMKDVVDFIASCPDWLVPQPTGKDNEKHKIYSNDSEIKAFATSGLRGYTPTLLFWDETAWAENSEKFWTATRPAVMNTGGRAIFVSCVTKDSFIFTNNGIKQVKEFINSEELGGHEIEDSYILGKDKTRKSNIIFNNGYVNTLKINTIYSELESSYNHKYWAYKNGVYGWFKASELEVDDYISIQKGIDVWGSNDDCSDFKPKESKHIKNIFKPTKITEDIAYLIGLYISEGYFRKIYYEKNTSSGQLVISCGDDVSDTFNNLNIPFTCSDGIHYITSSYQLLQFFEYLGFDLSKKAPQKTIPSKVLEMGRDNIIAMMQGIMDGDGWTSYNEDKNKLRVGIGLSSLELIKQIRMIFNNFGILTEYQEVLTPITKLVKVTSIQHRIVANNLYAKKYHDEIGFRFERKSSIGKLYNIDKLKHCGVSDNIPNGSEIVNEIYNKIKSYGKLKELNENNIKISDTLSKKKNKIKPISRKTILKLINYENIEYNSSIINENIVWVKIKSIEKSKDFTYDFSMSNDNEKEDEEFHMSLIYNGLITHQTPNGLDPIFYKTFEAARKKKSQFNAVELWWFNDPRYIVYKKEHMTNPLNRKEGELDLRWIKKRGEKDEVILVDEGWDKKKRIQLQDDGWIPCSSWMDDQIREYNGDTKKLAQELLCVFPDTKLIIRNKTTGIISEINISDLYTKLVEENNS